MLTLPQYLLMCDSQLIAPACIDGQECSAVGIGKWHFVLERLDSAERLEAVDSENYIHRDRLALLAVVRGLEALEQASRVRLITTSRYVDRGLRFGLPNWREANYQWESFGVRKPIRNADLWRRVDGAAQFHEIICRLLKGPLGESEAAVDEACLVDGLAGAGSAVPKPGLIAHPLPTEQSTWQVANTNSWSSTADTIFSAAEAVENSGSLARIDRTAIDGLVKRPHYLRHSRDAKETSGNSAVASNYQARSNQRAESGSNVRDGLPHSPRTQWWDMATYWSQKPMPSSNFQPAF